MWNPDFYKASFIFNPLLPVLKNFQRSERWPSLQDYNQHAVQSKQKITSAAGKPIHFIHQTKSHKDFISQYEPSVYLEGAVQTREENWHDFFNMLVWLAFPRAKSMLNKQQYLQLKNRLNRSDTRSPAENFLTLFDENGAIILSSNPELSDLLRRFQWEELFWRRRKDVTNTMRFLIFGHSLYEKSLNPYLGMTASSAIFTVAQDIITEMPENQLAIADQLTAEYLSHEENICSPRNLMPLPVLGVPGWSVDNDHLSYYQNTAYFRQARNR